LKTANWFKILWWVVLLLGFGALLTKRYNDLVEGKSFAGDVLVLVVWLALLLLPLFREVSFFGMTFKRELEELKKDVKAEVASVRAEIRNSVDIRAQISPNIVFPPPPPDSQLPAIEKRIQASLEEMLRNHNTRPASVSEEALVVPSDADVLFRARYNIERELRRIWEQHTQGTQEGRFVPTLRIAQSLAEWELINGEIARAIREVWQAASPAIHGQSVTQAKVAFVRDVAPRLVVTLKAIA
jgi:hypothetical protein